MDELGRGGRCELNYDIPSIDLSQLGHLSFFASFCANIIIIIHSEGRTSVSCLSAVLIF